MGVNTAPAASTTSIRDRHLVSPAGASGSSPRRRAERERELLGADDRDDRRERLRHVRRQRQRGAVLVGHDGDVGAALAQVVDERAHVGPRRTGGMQREDGEAGLDDRDGPVAQVGGREALGRDPRRLHELERVSSAALNINPRPTTISRVASASRAASASAGPASASTAATASGSAAACSRVNGAGPSAAATIAKASMVAVTVFVAGTARSGPASSHSVAAAAAASSLSASLVIARPAAPAACIASSVRTISGVRPDWLTAIAR